MLEGWLRFLVKMSSQDLSSASVVASTFRFHPAAEVELSAVADWYEGRRPGLGRQFVDAVHAKVDDTVDGPRQVAAIRRHRPRADEQIPVRSRLPRRRGRCCRTSRRCSSQTTPEVLGTSLAAL